MNPERLVDMANDIAANLVVYPDHDAAVGAMVLHLQRFWEPTMRRRIVDYLHVDGHRLSPLAREAIEQLSHKLDEAPLPTARGASDAG